VGAAEPGELAKGGDERILDDIFRQMKVADDVIGHGAEAAFMPADKFPKRRGIASDRPNDQLCIGYHRMRSPKCRTTNIEGSGGDFAAEILPVI